MARPALWTAIAETLRAEIAAGHYAPGARLPTEAGLAARFGVNRHTVRRALAALGAEGLVHSRRGAGAFVAAPPPAEYPLGRRVRFHRNLLAAGRTPDRRLLHRATRQADAAEAEALDLAPGAPVHVCEGVSLADGVPVSLFRSVFPAEALPGLPDALAEHASITRALAACGVEDHVRVATRLDAVAADAAQAALLQVAPGAPLLRSVSLNVDAAGRPVEHGRTHFVGERVTLTLAAEDTGPDRP
jgi:GntR family phosphonate transport system transcriptional regulator